MKPGQSVTMKMRMHMMVGMEGPHLFQVRVTSNDPVEPQVLLMVKANYVRG